MRKRKYMKLLAGLLCAAVISADLMSAGLLSLAAEAANMQETETQAQEEMGAQEQSFENVSSVLESEAFDDSSQTPSSEILEETETESQTQEKSVSETTETSESEAESSAQWETISEDEETMETQETITETELELEDISETETQEAKNEMALVANENIASGVINKSYGHITWMIDTDGKLTVTGTGDFSDSKYTGSYGRAPWYTYVESIRSAKINVTGMTNASSMFLACSNMVSVDLSNFDTSNVTDMDSMFADCSSLSSLNVSNFDTSNVTNMIGMFWGCSSLSNLDLSSFNTSNVTDMDSMFADCHALINLNLSSFNTSNVHNMAALFEGCGSLSDLKLNNFDTSNVTNMYCMFSGCESLSSLDLSNFDTSNVADMGAMFYYCSSLSNLILNNFDTSNVTNMHGMFWGCHSLNSLSLVNFDTSNVTFMSGMFYDCRSIINLDLSKFKTTNVTTMNSMFSGCRLLNSLDLSNFDTSNVIDMTYMFSSCRTLSNLNLNNFNTSNVTEMYGMFFDCRSLSSLNLHNFNTSNVTTMGAMFSDCPALSNLNIDSFDTSNVTDMSEMFTLCSSLNNLNLDNFNTSNVTNMYCMFFGCSSLSSLNLQSFNTSNVTDMSSMFADCSSLNSLNIDSFDTSNVTDMRGMFAGCNSLENLNLSNFDTSNVTSMGSYGYIIDIGGMFAGCSSLSSLNLSSFDTSNVTDMLDVFKNCTNLSTIYTPYNLKLSVTLPIGNSTDRWYCSDGTTVIELPKNLSYSVELGKNYVPQEKEPEHSLTVYFDIQGGEALAPITGIASGSTISLPASASRTGYIFEGWYTQPVGGIKIADDAFTVTETVTLYAHWRLIDEDIDTENQGDGLWISGVNKAGYTYTGDAIIPAITVWDNATPLTEKIDYTIAYKNNKNVGEATITVSGKGNYSGKETFSFSITPANIETDVYADSFYVKTNAKKAQKPVPELYYMGTKLKNNKDFTITYSNTSGIYAQEGEYSVTITGVNNYAGTKTLTLTAVSQIPKKKPVSITKATLAGFEKSFPYTGKACIQSCTLKITADGSEKTLVEGADYTVRYANNIKAGTATVTYYGKNGYTGKLKKTYKIAPYDIAADSEKKISYDKTLTCVYAKGGARPKPAITFGNRTLREGADYTLSYKNNKSAGGNNSASVTINGKGSFKGKITIPFTINQQDLSKMTLVSCDKVYSNKAGTYKITPKLIDLDGKLLSAGKDFDKSSITYSYEEDTDLGDGSVKKAGEPVADTDTIPAGTQIRVTLNSGNGNNYTGTFTGAYRIVQADIKSAKISIPTQSYTGNAIVPDKQQIKVMLKGVTLRDEDYDIVLCTNNQKKGKASITIKGKGNYGGTKTAKFTIAAKGFLWWWRK